LAVVLVVVGAALAFWRFEVAGAMGITAAALAAAICLVGAVSAFLTTALVRSPQAAVGGVLLGMAFRMGFPLIVLLAVLQQGGPLMEAGLAVCFLVCYPIALVTETLLVLPLVRQRSAAPVSTPSA
jgi:hypothetical protein